MRALKFRAWDGKNVWYFELADWRLDGGTLYLHDFPGNINVRLDKCEIMQYTGLKDKNGKEIYEGDIVSCYWDDGGAFNARKDCPVSLPVEFDARRCGYSPFCDYDSDCDQYIEMTGVEVIGNIYENTALGRSKA